MSLAVTEATPNPQPSLQALHELQAALRAAGAPQWDAVGWHYIERLADRAGQQTGRAQALLFDKLQHALHGLKARRDAALAESAPSPVVAARTAAPSPLAALLQEMTPAVTDAGKDAGMGTGTLSGMGTHKPPAWRAESPRIRQFRKQLGQIHVQKQVSQAIAQAPQNAGPINSHMLVLRSLGLMRDASPDYLNRFMAYVDTLLCLDDAGQGKLPQKKPRR